MPKGIRLDSMCVRKGKANGQKPLTTENQNQNRNAKKNPTPVTMYKYL